MVKKTCSKASKILIIFFLCLYGHGNRVNIQEYGISYFQLKTYLANSLPPFRIPFEFAFVGLQSTEDVKL